MPQAAGENTMFQQVVGVLMFCLGIVVALRAISSGMDNWRAYGRDTAGADEASRVAIVLLGCRAVDNLDGMLIYTSCPVTQPRLSDMLPDSLREFLPGGFFGVDLSWSVEILQWVDVYHKDSDPHPALLSGLDSTYPEKVWVSSPQPSPSHYLGLVHYENVGEMPKNIAHFGTLIAQQESVFLSAHEGKNAAALFLGDNVTRLFPPAQLHVSAGNPSDAWKAQGFKGTLTSNMLHFAGVEEEFNFTLKTGDEVGDFKITLRGRAAPDGEIANVVAKEVFSPLGAWLEPYGDTKLLHLEFGKALSKNEFIAAFTADNGYHLWDSFKDVCFLMIMATCCCLGLTTVQMLRDALPPIVGVFFLGAIIWWMASGMIEWLFAAIARSMVPLGLTWLLARVFAGLAVALALGPCVLALVALAVKSRGDLAESRGAEGTSESDEAPLAESSDSDP